MRGADTLAELERVHLWNEMVQLQIDNVQTPEYARHLAAMCWSYRLRFVGRSAG